MVLDVGWLGSVTDVATLVVVLVSLRYELRPKVETIGAAVVALAEKRRDVDHQHLRAELGIDDVDVDQVRPTIVCGGEADD